jgi:hypothetical protein
MPRACSPSRPRSYGRGLNAKSNCPSSARQTYMRARLLADPHTKPWSDSALREVVRSHPEYCGADVPVVPVSAEPA